MVLMTVSILLSLLFLSIPVAAVLGTLGLSLSALFSPLPLSFAAGEIAWSTTNNFLLVAIPLFVLLGELLLRSGLAEKMYSALVIWMPWLPGGLMQSNIVACGMFAATSGSSLATAATIGTVAVGEIEKKGYNEKLFLGTIAAGGTLGILIPPSVNLILYGVLTDTSIPQLYMAALVPGVLLALGFMLFIGIVCLIKPEFSGRTESTSWAQKMSVLPDLLPPMIIFGSVIGAIYAGLATATEAAALGVIATLIIILCHKRLNLKMLKSSFEGTMKTTAMIMAVMVGAYFLNLVFGAIGLAGYVSRSIEDLELSHLQLFLLVVVFYMVLGMFMETLSMMVSTVPIIAPIMVSAGFDPVWFGVLVVVLMEMALISPPVGMNLFVVQGVRTKGKIDDVIIGTLPFLLVIVLFVVLLYMFPGMVLNFN